MDFSSGTGIELISKPGIVSLGNQVYVTGASKTDEYESDITNYVLLKLEELNFISTWFMETFIQPSRYEPYTLYDSLKESPAHITLRGHIHRNDGIVQVGTTRLLVLEV